MMPTKKSVRKAPAVKAPADAPDQPAKATWTRAEAEAHVRSLRMRCLGPRDEKRYAAWQKLMADGKLDAARALQTRVGCGYDFGETVIAGGFDGKDHVAICPQCGVSTSYRAPTFPGVK